MQARTALIAAIVSGVLAVVVVGADVAWSLEATIEAEVDGDWRTVTATHPADSHLREPFHPTASCPGPDFRLVVDNDRPIPATVAVQVTIQNLSSQRSEMLLRETVSLDAFSKESFDLSIPDAAFPEPDQNRTEPWDRSVQVQAQVGDHILWAAFCKEASA